MAIYVAQPGDVTIIPPAGQSPSHLDIGPVGTVPANFDGTFTLPPFLAGQLIWRGWSYKVTVGTTHVP